MSIVLRSSPSQNALSLFPFMRALKTQEAADGKVSALTTQKVPQSILPDFRNPKFLSDQNLL